MTAAHGYGKSTLLTGWARVRDVARLELGEPDRDAAVLAARLEQVLRGDGRSVSPRRELDTDGLVDAVVAAASAPPSIVVLDEADEVLDSEAVALLRGIVTRPGSKVRVVVAGRVGLGLADDVVRARGGVLELEAADLAFDPAQVAELLPADVAPGTAERIVELTGGWPALVLRLVELTAGSNRGVELRPEALLGPDGHVTPTLTELLVVEEDRETLDLLAEIALLAPTGAAELARIRGTSTRTMAAVLGDLLTRGLVQGPPGGRGPGSAGRVGLAPLVRRAVIDELVARDGCEAGAIVEVVDGLRGVGEVHRALTALAEIGASRPVADLLEEHGAALVDAGRAPAVARACEIVVDADRTAGLEAVHARALESHGELAGALDRVAAGLDRVTGATDGTRLHLHVLAARIHLLRGELPAVIAVSREGDDPERHGPDAGQLRAARAQAHLRRWELDEASSVAQVCLRSAEHDGGAAVLALAHRVLADLASAEGRRDDHERHHRRAYAAAEQSGVASELVQVRVQRGVHHLARGRTTEALFELDRALAATSSSVLDAGRAAVLTARAEVSLRTGRVHAAARDAEAARSVYDRLGSREARGPLHLLGDVHRERGDLEAAREAYGRALALADPDGDARAALAATIGMARCATDVDEARRAAERALELPGGPVCAGAHLAAAWAGLAGGARDDARDHAERAAQVAAARHDERGTVEASTLLAVLGDEPVEGLRRAARAWHRVHDPSWATRTELALARRSERADDRSRAGDLERRLARLGSVVHGGEVAHRQLVAPGSGGSVELRLLGGFEVLVEGRAVTDQLASDDEARRVLQVVAVAAGRSVAREELVRALWPDGAPTDATTRLDEAIARVRGLLRHHERWTAPLVGDATALRLRVESIGVDLSIFERSGELGLRAAREGHRREADALLRTALAAHGGELLAGEPSTGWAAARRRAVRQLADEVHRALATLQPRDTGREG